MHQSKSGSSHIDNPVTLMYMLMRILHFHLKIRVDSVALQGILPETEETARKREKCWHPIGI